MDEVNQVTLDIDRTVPTAQGNRSFGLRIENLDIELCIPRTVFYQRGQVGHEGVIQGIRVDSDCNLLNSLFLHGLQILYITDLEIVVVAVELPWKMVQPSVSIPCQRPHSSPKTASSPLLSKSSMVTMPNFFPFFP